MTSAKQARILAGYDLSLAVSRRQPAGQAVFQRVMLLQAGIAASNPDLRAHAMSATDSFRFVSAEIIGAQLLQALLQALFIERGR